MIDWSKPIETVPDALNPAPVPCYLTPEHDENATRAVFINGGWRSSPNCPPDHIGNDFWWYEEDGTTGASFLPVLRNVGDVA